MKPALPAKPTNHIAVFQESSIRRIWHNEEWWFALSDVIVVLTDSADPRQYIKKMRSRDPALDANWSTTCTPLALLAPDGKVRETNCANTEGLFRIIQSSRDVQRIEHTLDQLLDVACLPDGLALFKTLCRHYWTLEPHATASYVQTYREMWDDEGANDTEEMNP